MKQVEFSLYTLCILLILTSLYQDWLVEEWKSADLVDQQSFDVIVVGGEPEGVAAAVSAARNGANTLLIEHRDDLGGLFTYGKLNFLDLGYDKDGRWISRGIFREWHQRVGSGIVFDVDEAKRAFRQLAEQPNTLKLSLNTKLLKAVLAPDGKTLRAIIIQKGGKTYTLSAKRFIDSTQDADLAAMAGVPYFYGQEDLGLKNQSMSATLMIHLAGVNWSRLEESVQNYTHPFGSAQISDTYLWGFPRVPELYQPQEAGVRIRGLNIARNLDGTIYINALQIMGVNGLNATSRIEAIKRGKRETKHFVEYLRDVLPGFEEARIASYPPELYIRETRHILSEYQLPITDVWENKDHWDSIGMASYPVDVQTSKVNEKDILIVSPLQYAIPFRSLVPKKIDGLLVASRSSGYSSMAAGSARVVPTGMTTAQAAGAAAALSLDHSISFRELSRNREFIMELQQRLKSQGLLLYRFHLPFPYQNSSIYPILKNLLKTGLVRAGYHNNLYLSEPMEEAQFIEFLQRSCLINQGEKYCSDLKLWRQKNHLLNYQRPLTNKRFTQIIHELKLEQRVITPITATHQHMTNQEAYWSIYQILQNQRE